MKKQYLALERVYTKNNPGNPFFGVNFISRSITVKGENGEIIFQNEEVIAPDFWSEHAVTILAKNYFRKMTIPHDESSGEHDLRDVIKRLCLAWTSREYTSELLNDEGRAILADEMAYMLVHQIAAPNSPQWFNTGLFEMYNMPPKNNSDTRYYVDERTKSIVSTQDEIRRAQAHACFIVGLEDNMVGKNGIYDTIKTSAKLFKLGSGSGINITALRSASSPLSGGGVSSGPLSFAKIFDASAASIKSGGTTRRAAQMLSVDIDHADVERFIDWKATEENKLSSLVLGSTILNNFWQDYVKALFSIVDQSTLDRANPQELHKHLLKQSASVLHYLSNQVSADDYKADQQTQVIAKYASLGVDDKNIMKTVYLVDGLLNFRPIEQTEAKAYMEQLLLHISEGCYKTYDYDFNGEGVQSLSGQSVNVSIRVGQDFMEKALSGQYHESYLLDKIALRAWESGDPALQYTGAIDLWHTCKASGRINASNPCSEFMFLDNTACNLASLNLAKFLTSSGTFDYETFAKAVELWALVLDISITMAQFPTEIIALNSYAYRPLGLGFCNLGYMLSVMKLPYADNTKTLETVSKITALMTGSVYRMSARMAQIIGPFAEYEKNKSSMTEVLSLHAQATQKIAAMNDDWGRCIEKVWQDVLDLNADTPAKRENNLFYGVRNAQATCIAPTGTIGFVMGAATTGIEPEFSYKTWKKVMDGSWMELPSQTFEQYLDNFLDSSDKDLVLQKMSEHHNSLVSGLEAIGHDYFTKKYGPAIINEMLATIKVANSPDKETAIAPRDHIKIMGATQPFISGAISKTINLPGTAVLNDIKEVYFTAFKEGLKGVTVYRDGCKGSQPLNLSREGESSQDIIARLRLSYKAGQQDDDSYINEYGQKMVKVVCPNCKSEVMKPNGTCSVCLNCGQTTGCS